MLTAKQVAEMLGLSVRTVYTLPIPCYRFGTAVRYKAEEVEGYRESCRSTGTSETHAGALSSRALSASDDTALLNYFQKAGRRSKQTPGPGKKKQDSTVLQLVR